MNNNNLNQSLSDDIKKVMAITKNFLIKQDKWVYLFSLAIFCYVFLFFRLGNYPLIDVDETRYASMAREILQTSDWITMHLNYGIFYEKPPLYFWLLAFSYSLFGKVCELSARFPIAILSTAGVFGTYYFGKKIISPLFGFVSALILLSSLEFIVLSRIAILDMVVSILIMAALYSGMLAFLSKDGKKKYYWILTYLFCALGVLAKGLLSILLVFGVLGTYA